MDTTARGAFPALYLSYKRLHMTAMADMAFSGPLSISAWINGKYAPSAPFKAYPFSVMVKEAI